MSLDIYLYKKEEVFDCNITHNLGEMASKAGIYYHLWRPDEIGVEYAGDLIKPLEQGLHLLKTQKEEFISLNPDNGWGNYEGLVTFVEKYLEACRENKTAKIEVNR